MMKIQDNYNSTQFYRQQKTFRIIGNQKHSIGGDKADSSQVSFKGKFSFMDVPLMKMQFLKELFSKILPKKGAAPVQVLKSETKKIVKIINKVTAPKTLPFDANARLAKLGVKPEFRQKIIDAANGNKEHYQKLARMIKDGYDPELLPEIFNKAKGGDGKLKMSYFNAALILKEQVDQKYIIPILENFRLSSSKFDYDAFREFQNLKSKALKAHAEQRNAFISMDKPKIDEFFYTNIDGIKKTSQLLGRNHFEKLYNYNFEYLDLLVEKTPSFLNSIAKYKKIEKLTREKMNPISQIVESNAELFDRKVVFSPQAHVDFQNRISTLMELFEYAELLNKGNNRHITETAQMVNLLNKLPS